MGTCAQSKPKRNPNVINIMKKQQNKWSGMENRPQINSEPLELLKSLHLPPLDSITTENPVIKQVITNINTNYTQKKIQIDQYNQAQMSATNNYGDAQQQMYADAQGYQEEVITQQRQDEYVNQGGNPLDMLKNEIQQLKDQFPFLKESEIYQQGRIIMFQKAISQHDDLGFIYMKPGIMTSETNVTKIQKDTTTNINQMNLVQANQHNIYGDEVNIKN